MKLTCRGGLRRREYLAVIRDHTAAAAWVPSGSDSRNIRIPSVSLLAGLLGSVDWPTRKTNAR